METIESFIKCKYIDQSLCEDGIYTDDYLAAVIDGATSDRKHLFGGKAAGLFAKDAILDALGSNKECYLMNPYDLFMYLSDQLRTSASAYIEYNGSNYDLIPRASVIIYNAYSRLVYGYGDCQCIVDGVLYSNSKKIDQENSGIRAHYINEALEQGITLKELAEKDIGREAIKDRLRNQHEYENVPGEYGYPVINGVAVCEDMISIIPVTSDQPVILATDGYPFLENTLKESENRLSDLLREDPLCFRIYKSTKGKMNGCNSFDDRAFWRGSAPAGT